MVKMTKLYKVFSKFNEILIKTPMTFFADT